MAQIKLGLALTDIKGKVGGSVFSSNKNGKYFRNNSVGGGRSSAIWDTKKTILGSVAQRWRKLSHGQREAWNLAATQIPKTNKVGDVVYWSGFNYFSSVNSKRLNLGGSPINLPPELESFPDIADFEVNFLPYDQYVPKSSFAVNKVNPAAKRSYLNLTNFTPPAIGEPGPSSVIWLDVDWYNLCMSSPNCSYDICTDTYGIDTTITVSVEVANHNFLVFTVKREEDEVLVDSDSFPIYLADIRSMQDKPLILLLEGGIGGSILTSLSPDIMTYDFYKSGDETLQFVSKNVFLNHGSTSNLFPLSMVSLYEMKQSVPDVLAVLSGYITPNLTAATSFAELNGNQFVNDLADQKGAIWQLSLADGAKPIYRRTRQIIKPVIYLTGLETLGSGMQYQVDYSPALSDGRTSSNSRYRFGQLTNPVFNDVYDVNAALLLEGWAQQPVMAPGSSISVRVSIVNSGLDQKSPPVRKESRDGPKFKGGADLPDAVN